MSHFSKIAWTEGTFLRPQHFQQQERYFSNMQQKCNAMLSIFPWGVSELEIDDKATKFSQFGITSLQGILPDGTLLELPMNDLIPSVIEIPKSCREQQVFLCLAFEKVNSVDIATADSTTITRYQFSDQLVSDNTLSEESAELLQVAQLRLLLKLESEDRGGYIAMPIAKIKEVSEHGEIKLDKKFIPPTINIQRNGELKGFIQETLGMLRQRAEALAARISRGQGNANSIADFLMLQVLNRYEPIFQHIKQSDGQHPEYLYQHAITMLGELATFTSRDKRAPEFPQYNHTDLATVFGNLSVILNQTLSVVLEQTAIALPIEQAKFGIMVSPLTDKTLLEYAQFVLAVSADLPADDVRKHLPARLKIGPVEHIRELVNNQLPGIAVTGLPVAPRQVPYHAGFHYFQLDKSGIYWEKLSNSGGLALHLSGNYPGLKLELWAIKS
ncbi:type VI secretion system baseplate subunit TssK [Shewanella baltica]|uniref:type VI secretion system baseplate subunit TssK n=1 Tax=Shewanella baltica TaxID=62322 RepID=UPI00217CE6A0|nr:type VI secretion system baseplate subunit TssK [Shewanella baltica]MCS6180330.1 type VI secretion system baseplate subunit TssK [Shewanella baltica]MCS6256593.1 type VI secretion system baseplate subunit TssK [Shewanella baltica]